MNGEHFREEQRFRQPWVWAVVVLCSAVSLLVLWRGWSRGALAEEPLGNAVAALVALGGPALFWRARLLTVVEGGRLRVRFRPFLVNGDIAASEIAGFGTTKYSPILEYGGWGVRWRPGKGRAYNVSGDRGVRLTLSGGEELLIGSRRSEELAAAIARAGGGR